MASRLISFELGLSTQLSWEVDQDCTVTQYVGNSGNNMRLSMNPSCDWIAGPVADQVRTELIGAGNNWPLILSYPLRKGEIVYFSADNAPAQAFIVVESAE